MRRSKAITTPEQLATLHTFDIVQSHLGSRFLLTPDGWHIFTPDGRLHPAPNPPALPARLLTP